jgi:hypothetical protein
MAFFMEELLVEVYELFTSKIKKEKFKWEVSDVEQKHINSFIKKMKPKYGRSIGKTFLMNLAAFQYEYYSKLDHRFKKSRIPFAWIFGKKAIERWKSRHDEDLFFAHKYADSIGISISSFNVLKVQEVEVERVKFHEEVEKRRFFNTYEGFNNCMEVTTLYNRKSPVCIRCSFKGECKLLLKKNYPNIYVLRGFL